jgi:iron complex transport system substrate-binding protein
MLIGLLLTVFAAQSRTITDMAGRTVAIPQKINRVLPHDDKTAIFLYPYFGTKLISRGMNMDNVSLKYMAANFQKLPTLDIKNAEEVIKSRPDVIIAGVFLPEDIDRYELLSKKTKIPLIIIDLNIMKLDDSYRFLVKLFGETPKSKECLAYLNSFYETMSKVTKTNPKKNASVYLAVGNKGLRTAPVGSKHAQVLDLLKIKNVANIEIEAKGYAGVSIEQIMVWKPDYIFTVDKERNDPFTEINKSPLWKNIPAVQKKQVIHIPEDPFNWFDSPPSINRVPGLILLMELFYQYPTYKAHAMVKDFYRVFYNYPLTDAELSVLLLNRS